MKRTGWERCWYMEILIHFESRFYSWFALPVCATENSQLIMIIVKLKGDIFFFGCQLTTVTHIDFWPDAHVVSANLICVYTQRPRYLKIAYIAAFFSLHSTLANMENDIKLLFDISVSWLHGVLFKYLHIGLFSFHEIRYRRFLMVFYTEK